jgi:alcohol dehydrogenase (cytochrome c)
MHTSKKLLALLALALAQVGARAAAPNEDTAAGSVVFDSACAHCHGADGRGSQLGPSLLQRVAKDGDAELGKFLRTGSPERGMPPAAVTDGQMSLLLNYLRFLAASGGDSSKPATAKTASATTTTRAIKSFTPIDDHTLLNPSPDDWLWFSRTPDAQRFSPLKQVNTGNVSKLALAWARSLPNGLSYAIPLEYQGVLYLSTPTSTVMALDATTGDPLWEYHRQYANPNLGTQGHAKTIAIYDDMVYFTEPDATIVALDARTGQLRWEAPAGQRGHSGGVIVAKGKVISNGNCIRGPRDNCFIAANDAHTGKLLWKFNTIKQGDNDTWGGVPLDQRLASPWGLPGSYDPVNDLIYWGIANPMPTSRSERHGGNSAATAYSSPADLYSNSTVALNPDTGALVWYYQHLPGDDWDLDMNQERTLLRTAINPDPKQVRWINPDIKRGSVRDVVVNVGEGGGIWLLDRHSGEFLWATPFPFDVKNFFLSNIDVKTGKTYINRELLVERPGERHVVCYFNTRSFWPTAYYPDKNALYVPYIRNCLDMTSANPATKTPERRVGSAEPGVPENELNGLAKINLETGQITHWPMGRIPTNSAILTTAGNLVFWGDINRHYRAMDADSGKVLWDTTLGGPVSMSNITYSVNGRQYIAVIAGETLSQQTLTRMNMGPIPLQLDEPTGQATLYVFALPDTPKP